MRIARLLVANCSVFPIVLLHLHMEVIMVGEGRLIIFVGVGPPGTSHAVTHKHHKQLMLMLRFKKSTVQTRSFGWTEL